MILTAKYQIPVDDYYYIPAGSEVKFCGYDNGFTVIEYNQTRYIANEQYFVEAEVLTG